VSPLASEDYREYRDGDFLEKVGLAGFIRDLKQFWPNGGPSWDALGILEYPNDAAHHETILVEAKSYPDETYGDGCSTKGQRSVATILSSLEHARLWCGASADADWTGRLYQPANRIAHLCFLLERIKRPAWLVNLYFLEDPIRPTSLEEWERHIASVNRELGLAMPVSNVVSVFLRASGFHLWNEKWSRLAGCAGDCPNRIERVLSLWNDPVPAGWERGIDPHLLTNRYRRGDLKEPRPGEHAIEYEILCRSFDRVQCFGRRLVDGVNAIPLVRDSGGGRSGNVEADMFLLIDRDGLYELAVCEVKHSADDPWFAAVENLRQLRLLFHSKKARNLFLHRGHSLPPDIPAIGLVVAPAAYYERAERKGNSLQDAKSLLRRLRAQTGTQASLAVWDSQREIIEPL
jgi:hypothetical protein